MSKVMGAGHKSVLVVGTKNGTALPSCWIYFMVNDPQDFCLNEYSCVNAILAADRRHIRTAH